ncbi:MAG: hypothetical protein ACK52R_01380 [Betaproteobacteria bacterium]|nr:hypothetical protein [Rubrivivax sp.]
MTTPNIPALDGCNAPAQVLTAKGAAGRTARHPARLHTGRAVLQPHGNLGLTAASEGTWAPAPWPDMQAP